MANKDYVQASYHYDAAGRLLSRILSNGAATLYHYDKDGFLIKTTQRSSAGDVIDERRYTQDSVGNITQIAITGGDTTHYGYDPAYRLTQVNASDVTNNQTFSYDGVGNRLSKTHNGVTSNYTYSIGNRLDELRHGTTRVFSYDYDDNGSRINKRNSVGTIVESYEYNQKRLITQMNSAGSVTNFAYDPNLYRIQKSSSTGTNNYLLEAEHFESVYDENNQLKSSYLRGVVVDEIINGFERDANGNMLNRTFHHDQVNSVIALSDHNGATAQKRAYTPFGLDLSSTGTSENRLAYTGREQDNESSLYYYRARYYDPEVGRFMSEDPLGFEAGINFYAYVNNNPVNFNDPFGKDAAEVGISFRLLGTGISLGAEVRYSGVNDEPFDVGISGSFTPGLVGETIIGLIDSDNPFANASEGLDLVRLTLDVGIDTMPREQSSFIGVEVFSGVPTPGIGGIGITGLFDANQDGSLPTGGQVNIGPQLRGGANMMLQGSVTVRDVIELGGSAIDYISDQFSGTSNNTAAGGFVLYPSKLNTNSMYSVYSK
ncbi:MAG: hypothetical protein L3J89_14930 [Gammaproteobacteria bacterium]|nr:hypothetical protein [Gammaproteobacteria bacterium]